MTVRRAAWSLAMAGMCTTGLVGCGGHDDDAAPAAAATSASKMAAHALWAAQGAALNLQASQQAQAGKTNPAMVSATAGPDVQKQAVLPCANGGTVDVNITSLLPFTLSAGFTACTQAVVTINGALSLTATGFFQSGSLLGFDSTASNFEVAVGPVAQRLNGDTHVAITSLAPVTLQASSTRLGKQSLLAGVVTTSAELSGLDATLVFDTGASTVTSTVNFLATGSFIGLGQGSLQVQTLQPMVTSIGALFPASGQLHITRDQVEVTLVTVLGATTRLEVDADGNGTVDRTEDIATGDLFALLG